MKKEQSNIEPIDFRYDEGMRDRTETDIIPTITTKSSGFSGMPLLAARERESMEQELSIRKLTPLECFKLMGFSEDDYNSVKEQFGDTALYHVAGDSIVTTCLISIFGSMTDLDYRKIIKDYVITLKGDYE